ncbi:MAG: hypothetical protein M1318_00250 [Firmicutes bacterium]|jgi:hypothetical protein|nr:hypothetical protein [Bacillota bacterium]
MFCVGHWHRGEYDPNSYDGSRDHVLIREALVVLLSLQDKKEVVGQVILGRDAVLEVMKLRTGSGVA